MKIKKHAVRDFNSRFKGIKHGEIIKCPTCHSVGQLDVSDKEIAEFEKSIWFNNKIERWECWYCFLK